MVGPQGARTSLSVHMSCAACSYCDTDSTAQVSSVYHRHSLSIETLELSVRILTHVHVLKRFGGVANELSPARVRSRRRIRKRAASRLPRMHELAAVEQVQIVRPCMRKCSNYRRAKCRSLLSALAVHARRRMQLARLVAGWPCIHSQWCRLVCPHGHSCNV